MAVQLPLVQLHAMSAILSLTQAAVLMETHAEAAWPAQRHLGLALKCGECQSCHQRRHRPVDPGRLAHQHHLGCQCPECCPPSGVAHPACLGTAWGAPCCAA